MPEEEGSSLKLSAARVIDQQPSKLGNETVQSGEGPAGAAWKQNSAVILHEEPNSVLNRITSATGVDLTAVLAIPVYRQLDLRGVVVLGLGDGFGAAEVWSRQDRDELAVTSSYYAGLPSFEFITKHTRFPKGAGVPGRVWMTGEAQVAHNLDKASSFIRSFGNDPAKITGALGLPVASAGGFPASVLLLLEAAESPWSRCTELLRCSSSTPEDAPEKRTLTVEATEVMGQTEVTAATPWRDDIVAAVGEQLSPVLIDSGADSNFHLGWPVFEQGEPASIVSLTF